MPTASTSKSQGRVHQMSREEADALRREARRVVDAEVVSEQTRALPSSGNPIVRAVRAVVGGAQAVGRAAVGAVQAAQRNREQIVMGGKAFAAMAAKWGLEAATEAVRSEIRRTVTDTITGRSKKAAA